MDLTLRFEGLAKPADGLPGEAVGADAERVSALDLTDVGDLVENAGDIRVMQNPAARQRPSGSTP